MSTDSCLERHVLQPIVSRTQMETWTFVIQQMSHLDSAVGLNVPAAVVEQLNAGRMTLCSFTPGFPEEIGLIVRECKTSAPSFGLVHIHATLLKVDQTSSVLLLHSHVLSFVLFMSDCIHTLSKLHQGSPARVSGWTRVLPFRPATTLRVSFHTSSNEMDYPRKWTLVHLR